MKRFILLKVAILFVALLVAIGCSNPAAAEPEDSEESVSVEWAWVAGSSSEMASGLYGTKGVPNATNMPGSRNSASSWVDDSGNMWLFGGDGRGSQGMPGDLNDLWRFDGSHWTWVSGSDSPDAEGKYGTRGVAEPENVPGARRGASSWSDETRNQWLFGGRRLDGGDRSFNDLWRFDGSDWTWVSGSDSPDAAGEYGTQGEAAVLNVPGARSSASSWSDESGNLWLFGGRGYDSEGNSGFLNDLWRFDGSDWTWVSGSANRNSSGQYGTQGEAAPENVPGARWAAASWSDESGNLWLFGGYGRDAEARIGNLNDLWRFDGSDWIWVSGSDTKEAAGEYGTRGVAAPENVPGARQAASSWSDDSGNLWLFGGLGYDSKGNSGGLNDLWRFDGSDWTWVSGSDTREAAGEYGTRGVAAAENVPGARSTAAAWNGGSGDLWLFGGWSLDGGYGARLNDLWRFAP